ncbi:MAG: hypothetical protein AUG44_13795 [Actinobacteria bacterium 13_1_20CM_3_71_11]|nr:MAG: hypothetical protein AUG44_13795 [Actinobacteria bacterium 13_1_20CM_3_71_11]
MRREVTMTVTAVQPDLGPKIDDDLLGEAIRVSGASFPNEAINAALRVYVEAKREMRRKAREELRRMSDEGAFNYEALDEVDG